MKTKSYKWLSTVGLTLFGASILTGCADDNFNAPNLSDEITINFALADTPVVATRSGVTDNYIDNIVLLVYNSSDELINRQDISKKSTVVNDAKFTATVKMTDIREEAGTLTFYAVANDNGVLDDVKTTGSKKALSDLATLTDDLSGTYLSMSAKVESTAADLQSKDFELHRNAAKWSVGYAEDHQIEPGFAVKQFKVGNALPTTFVISAADGKEGTGTATTFSSIAANDIIYVAPKTTASDMYVLINATYNTIDGWYKVAMKNGFKVEANHKYEVQIKAVTSPGFSTEEEAIKAAPVNMEAEVKDHCPVVYSLSSTGTHTLGTAETIELSNTSVADCNLLIKTVCIEAGTCSNTTLPEVTVVTGEDWISVSGSVVSTSTTDDSPNVGKFYSQTLKILPLVGGNERTGKVMVKWGELTRYVEIHQVGVFNGAALGQFTISSKNDPSGNLDKVEYWSQFLGNDVAGVDEEAMCGTIRNHGLHFPIGLQEEATDPDKTSTLTTYSYTLSNIVENYQGSYVISLKQGSKFSGKLKVGNTILTASDKANGTFTASTSLDISLTSSSWDYIAEEGALIVKVTKDEKTTEFAYDLYQTGFFYKPSSEQYRRDGVETNKRLYYEVIKSTAGGTTTYWLDRNIGATAAGMYIEDANGADYMSDASSPFISGSQGGLYGISNEKSKSLDKELVPPGFRVPTASEFTRLTAASSFKTVSEKAPGNNKTYWTSYFNDPTSGRNVYFSKYRMIQSNGYKAGDGNTGYYWTRTEAVGASGDEVGYWWQAVKISGGSASIVRYRNQESGQSGLTALSVRAVRNTAVVETVETYGLTVKGYTHVYLYTVDDTGSRVPLNNWPGDQITTYNAATANSGNNPYDYDFTAFSKYSNVYVVLNKVNGNKVESSWFNGSGEATPGSKGWLIDAWSNRVTVPNDEVNDDGTIQYIIYWRKNVAGSYYNKIDIVDGSTTITRDGANYASHGDYNYVSYSTKSTKITAQPHRQEGKDNWWLNKTNDNGKDKFWTITKADGDEYSAFIDNAYHYTIVSYDSDSSVTGYKCHYGKPTN